MERNDAITTLEVLRANCSKHSRDYQALDYAISSLKIDEAYQIMYEGGEIFTKADLVAMLEEIDTRLTKLQNMCNQDDLNDKKMHLAFGVSRDVIQEKINVLEGEQYECKTKS